MKAILVLALSCIFFGLGSWSHALRVQATTQTSRVFTAAHKHAAEELMDAMNYRTMADQQMYEEIEQGIRARPDTAKMRDIMYEHAKKHLSFDSMKDELVEMFCQELSEQELATIAQFYRTPAGQEWSEKWVTLARQSAEISRRHHDESFEELRQAVLRRMDEEKGR